jgi:threonine/homoserine/homoserine lactone efflux protein
MTVQIMLAFAATAIVLVLLPSPLACQTALFASQKGRRSAVLTLPACAVGLSVALFLAMAPLALIALFLPGLLAALTWGSVAYLMLYGLWSLQDPRVCGLAADNDNLPQSGAAQIFSSFVQRSALAPRYIVVFAALLIPFLNPQLPLIPQLLEMQAVFLLCALVAMVAPVAFPRRLLGRKRLLSSANPAMGKPRARFISRRAVSAGYRRIAA